MVQQLRLFANEPANRICADCCDSGESMKHIWISTNLGIFLCINCAGAHRSLGTHISQTACLELDGIQSVPLIEHILKIGNTVANAFWLSHGSKGVKQGYSNLEALRKDRKLMEKYIEAKYCGKDFNCDLLSVEKELPRRVSGASRVCFGVLRVKILKGVSLHARSEDKKVKAKPFLTLQCGSCCATSRISQTVNPEWNQTIMMNLFKEDSILNICCWDSDFVEGMNGALGFASVPISEFTANEECTKKLKLDTEGEIHFTFELTPLE